MNCPAAEHGFGFDRSQPYSDEGPPISVMATSRGPRLLPRLRLRCYDGTKRSWILKET
jgi:hypothetical protein